MITIRKGEAKDLNDIVNVANSAFRPVRNDKFDFKKVMARIYSNTKDYTGIHHLLEVDGKLSAIAGNLIKYININGSSYKYANLGTVSTLPECEGRGYMKRLMAAVEEENISQRVVFSLLTGARKRYNYYGYERTGFRFFFLFSAYFAKHNKAEYDLAFCDLQDYYDEAYEIYKSNQLFVLREKEDFELYFRDVVRKKFIAILLDGEVVGYFVLKNNGEISDFNLKDNKYLISTLVHISKRYNKEFILRINPLNSNLTKELDKLAEYKQTFDNIMIKVYDMCKFLEMVVNINNQIYNLDDVCETYKIGEQIINITIKNHQVSVKECDGPYLAEFEKPEFLRRAIGFDAGALKQSRIFPLIFDIDDLDIF